MVIVVVGECEFAKAAPVAGCAMMVHVPVPIAGRSAESVAKEALQSTWSRPAWAIDGDAVTVTDTVAEDVTTHPPVAGIVYLKV